MVSVSSAEDQTYYGGCGSGSIQLCERYKEKWETQGPLGATDPQNFPQHHRLNNNKKNQHLELNSLPPAVIIKQDFSSPREENFNWLSYISSSAKAPRHLSLLRI